MTDSVILVFFMTGKGNHSANNVCKLRKYLLEQKGYKVEKVEDNGVKLKICQKKNK